MPDQCSSSSDSDVARTPASRMKTLRTIAKAITARYHLVKVEPNRFVVIDIDHIHMGYPGQHERYFIEHEPVTEPLLFGEAVDALMALREQRRNPDLNILREILEWGLDQMARAQSKG